jgi:hypothetical protein
VGVRFVSPDEKTHEIQRNAANQMLHNLCKRFINRHHLRSREDLVPIADMRRLVEDICECVGYEP